MRERCAFDRLVSINQSQHEDRPVRISPPQRRGENDQQQRKAIDSERECDCAAPSEGLGDHAAAKPARRIRNEAEERGS